MVAMHKPKVSLIFSSTLAVFLMLLGAGCTIGGGETSQSPTLGRQLEDLKSARDRGAISEPEYEHAKSRLLGGTPQTRVYSPALQADQAVTGEPA